MKKREVEVGGTYTAKVSGKLARVLVTGESRYGGWDAVNLDTKRKVRIRGAQRLRRRIDAPNGKDTGATTSAPVADEAPAERPAKEERGDATLPNTVAHAVPQTTGQEGDETMGKRKSKKQAKAKTYDGVCKSCGRTVRLLGTKGRCECGQALLARGGRVTRINEHPNGCVKGLPEATTLKAPEAPKPKRGRKPADGKLSGLDAAAQVLGEAGEPLNTKEMVKRMLDQGLWETQGKTPAATIYAAILREIQKKGAEARFEKVGRGTFALAK